jgi:hypothetical protein
MLDETYVVQVTRSRVERVDTSWLSEEVVVGEPMRRSPKFVSRLCFKL